VSLDANWGTGVDRRVLKYLRLLPTLAALLCGLYWFAFIDTYGLSFSFDSTEYMARALAMHHAGDYDVNPLWPPLYTWVLTVAMHVRPFPADAAAMVAGISIVAQLVLFALILRHITAEVIASLLAVVALASFAPFLYMYSWVWSEALFSTLLTAAFYFFVLFEEKRRTRYLLLCAAAVAFSSLARYVGLSAIVLFMAYIASYVAVALRTNGPIRRYVAAAIVAGAPLATCLLINGVRSGAFFGAREVATVSFMNNVELMVATLSEDLSLWMALLLVISVPACGVLFWRRQFGRARRALLLVAAGAGVLLAYVAFLLYATSTVHLDPVGTRYFSPIYFLPFLFVVAACGTALDIARYQRASWKLRLPFQAVLYSLLVCVIVGGARSVLDHREAVKLEGENTPHHVSGYDASATPSALARLFHRILERDGEMTIVVVFDYGMLRPRPAIGRSLFYRESSIQDGSVDHVEFVIDDGEDFTLWLVGEAGSRRAIHCRAVPRVSTGEEGFIELRRLADRENVERLYVLSRRRKAQDYELTSGPYVLEVLKRPD